MIEFDSNMTKLTSFRAKGLPIYQLTLTLGKENDKPQRTEQGYRNNQQYCKSNIY